MWYTEGTVAVTSGGTNITGTGTSFLTNARVGDGITITGSTALHEIIGVTSNTQLSIRPAYAGTTGSGRTYGISPLLGYDKDLSDAFNQLRLQFGDQLSNLQPWATASTQQEARNELEASSSGNTLFTGTLSQAQSHLQVQGVAGRGVVGGSGDLMAEGAFGLGDKGILLSDSLETPEISQIRSGGSASNFPANAGYYPALDLVRRYGTSLGSVRQMFSGPDLYVRAWTSSGAMNERRYFNDNNILGTVSQSGGVPTGAIIERGSNANGRYTKYADGTLICDNSNNAITTNPAAFVGPVTSIDGNKLRIGTWF